ncbi:PAS domain S-box protein [Bacillus sp. HMF5848]|uniref:SpoIIE family protein phosphatase n=1 Tax=Bacillus sp. HMF5848 TaxID=2495421 RepID=UPI000F7B4BD6|nr:SpoIIE family protein phosphatase [Bacillus sp. HMF5848]RSK27644.1 PAS domain S-box protein [Bacillus sp. HMF5848]
MKQSRDNLPIDNLYKVLFDQNPLPILIIRPNIGQICDVNQAAIDFYGFSKDDFLQKTVFDLNFLQKEEVMAKMAKVNEEGKSVFYFKHVLKNGQIKDVKVNSIRISNGSTNLLYSIITDITETKIRTSFFEILFKKSPYAILILDNEYRIMDVNYNFEELFQYKASDIVGRSPMHVIYPENTATEQNENIKEVEKSGLLKTNTIRKKKDGNLVYIELISFPIFNEDEHIATYALYRDLTETRQLQKQIEDNLDYAQKIQMSLLPKPIEEEHIKIHGHCEPWEKLGGDLYYWQDLKNGQYAVLIADVMGHGISASLICMKIRTLASDILHFNTFDPVRFVQLLNEHMKTNLAGLKEAIYFTGIFMLIDTIDKKISYVNCGHPYGVLLQDNGRHSLLNDGTVPIGLLHDINPPLHEISYSHNSRLVLYTDGVLQEESLSLDDNIHYLIRFTNDYTALNNHDFVKKAISLRKQAADVSDDVSFVSIQLL